MNEGNESFDALMRIADKHPPLSREIEQQLAAQCVKGDREAMNKLVVHNMKFAAQQAFKYRTEDLQLEDMMSVAMMGMMTAAEKFKPCGYRFISYATWWVRHALQRHCIMDGSAVAFPVRVLSTRAAMARCFTKKGVEIDDVTPEDLGGIATDDEKKRSLTSPLAVQAARMSLLPIMSLDVPMSKGESNSRVYLDLLEFDGDAPDHCIDTLSATKAIKEAMASLSEREQSILRLRYFETAAVPRPKCNHSNAATYDYASTLVEIGEVCGVTRERVRQILEVAVKKMRLRHGTILAEALGIKYDKALSEEKAGPLAKGGNSSGP